MATGRLSMRPSIGMAGYKVLPEMFKHRLHQLSEETINNLQATWHEAGYEEIECQRLLGDLLDKVKILFKNEVAAEQQILDHAKVQVRTTVEELRDMNEKLGRPTNIDYIKSMNYTDKLAELEKLIDEVSGEVSQRQGLLDIEMNAINQLVKILGETLPSENEFSGPPGTSYLSDIRLNLMKAYRNNLEETKLERLTEVTRCAKECYAHMADLMYAEEGYSTMSDSQTYLTIDKNIVKSCKNTKEFCLGLSKKEMQVLNQRVKRFAEEKEIRRNALASTGEEIAKLWSLLRVPSAERELFQNSFKKNLSMETVNKGYMEVTRLQELRKTSLAKVIANIRSDIVVLWEEAGMENETQRAEEFPQYFLAEEQLDEIVLDLHEVYYNQIRVRVEELRPLLKIIARRETVIQERIELEHLQLNPERLTARGPNAREERKREEAMTNRVKNLEKLSKEVLHHIAAWEESNGPFFYGVSEIFVSSLVLCSAFNSLNLPLSFFPSLFFCRVIVIPIVSIDKKKNIFLFVILCGMHGNEKMGNNHNHQQGIPILMARGC